jgi:hypothetical protein
VITTIQAPNIYKDQRAIKEIRVIEDLLVFVSVNVQTKRSTIIALTAMTVVVRIVMMMMIVVTTMVFITRNDSQKTTRTKRTITRTSK